MFELPYMRMLVPALTGILILASTAFAYNNYTEAKSFSGDYPTFEVVGTGEIEVTPDIATFSFTVSKEAGTQEEAQSQSAEILNAIIAKLKEEGVDEKDIKTEGYNLYPRYEWRNVEGELGDMPGFPTNQTRILIGYVASQNVTVKVRDTEEAGTLLSTAGSLGATDLSSLSFSIDDMEAVENEARALAIENAREQAEIRAKQLGMRLGKIQHFSENVGSPYQYDNAVMMESMARDTAVKTPEIPVGERTYSTSVRISYQLR